MTGNTLALASLCFLFSSCATPIKRQAHFIPTYEERVLLSGGIRFINFSQPATYTTPEMKNPPAAQVLRMADGSVKVTWITTARKSGKPIYVDNGLHPVEIPKAIIQDSKDLNAEIPIDKPFVLRFGETTAFSPDFIKLGGPVRKKR